MQENACARHPEAGAVADAHAPTLAPSASNAQRQRKWDASQNGLSLHPTTKTPGPGSGRGLLRLPEHRGGAVTHFCAFTMSASSYNHQARTWQERLEGACREANILPPVFQIVSDRRGGRTAWSSRVTVHGRTLSARFWYDGKNLNNAKEDAAEMALNYLTGSSSS
ncbi:hypothetical protein CCHR01_17570 [Colletotrichum chrysophilum]|uniref:DRBM domain-containing protein n=1 Tax=Colletotrichum chrysophilum TaxID=1836956 RepID=A0AAD9ECC7_9PEZI|nr:hypothetical protein CCHR01_17570 [Colletotrichum chrysophilum]